MGTWSTATQIFGKLVSDLTQRRHPEKRLGPGDEAHLDPDLDAGAYPREPGWRALLGQAEIAQRHLEKEGVAAGDFFLFFGLYRQVEASRTGWRFVRGARRLHLLWGWLQIGEVCKVDRIESDERFRWARYHDHLRGGYDETNTVHVASENLDLGRGPFSTGGWGFSAVRWQAHTYGAWQGSVRMAAAAVVLSRWEQDALELPWRLGALEV